MRLEQGIRQIAPENLIEEVKDIPNLIEVQMNSFKWFLEEGIRELFRNFSPIEDFTGTLKMELVDYHLEEPKYSQEECRQREMTYEAPIKVLVRLHIPNQEVLESEVYLGALPLMTERGTFIINGVERVVVSQLARSPGVYFEEDMDLSGRMLYLVRVIPSEGAWTEIETEANDAITVRIGQTRKFPITTLLRALNFSNESCPLYTVKPEQLRPDPGGAGLKELRDPLPLVDQTTGEVLIEAPKGGGGVVITQEIFEKVIEPRLDVPGALPEELKVVTACTSDRDILQLFCGTEVIERFDEETGERVPLRREDLIDRRPIRDLLDKNGRVLVPAFQKIDRDHARRAESLGLERLEVVKPNKYIEATLATDNTHGEQDALLDIYRKIRPGDPATQEGAKQLIRSLYYDLRRYDLARVGRYKINKKLEQNIPLDVRALTREDLINIVKYIIRLSEGLGTVDDIDHLENKRVRSMGELLQNQLRMGFLRMEKVAKERMTSMDPENASPQVVLSIKPISASIKSFFGSSQLCQFMDQHNPLAELTHKRRLSALGPGGLSRQSAKLEVRDVHHSHYGRICPIETPEGPNIGLIGSLAIFTKIDEFGFLLSPYLKVENGRVTDEVVYLTADQEEHARIAPANTPVDENGFIIPERVQVRYMSKFPEIPREQVEYMDRSPMQVFSPAAALIPFLENDDANRALMGSNMQRQAVPLIRTEAPIVRSGIEAKVARDSGAVILAARDGRVERVTADEIVVRADNGELDVYKTVTMLRSNQNTCIHQKPIVRKGQRVRAGQVIADGPCTENGELALGRNVLVAFMPWHGYNYEDAIIISRRLVKDETFTSIHIERHEVEARDTKLGPEEITRDIPHVQEDALKDLDENGIVRIGAEVRANDILVGKIAPKSQGEQSAEERLIVAIFGKKAEESSNVSLLVPHGGKGKVIDVKVFSRFKYSCSHCKAVFDFSKKPDRLTCDRCGGDLIREPGDELPAGVNQLVRVYVAQKRRIMEGDKMAGRHGNKGVISRILPEEEMPFMPDGTPVDIILNPLGVPGRMNIGQVLETHLGLVGRALGCTFTEPVFRGKKEPEVLKHLELLARYFRERRLKEYMVTELGFELPSSIDEELVDAQTGERLWPTDMTHRDGHGVSGEGSLEWLLAVLRARVSAMTDEERQALGEKLGLGADPVPGEPLEVTPDGHTIIHLVPPSDKSVTIRKVTTDEIVQKVKDNVWKRVGLDEKTGKCILYDGQTGEPFNQPVTVGHIYMMKLLHLVEDKMHARSIGPYALVTQQPLGGKAQFGGQRFGEMEVWALEAYGAAYTLQEILTIKSDDVVGRVKTYESIVKGEQIQEPGVPESFKILVAELQNLGLKVTVEDEMDREIDLRLQDDDMDGDGRARHKQTAAL